VARSAQHEVHVERNPHGTGFLCTLRRKIQFNGYRTGSGRCVLFVIIPCEVAPFIAATVQLRDFDTMFGKNGQYNTNPVFEDILATNGHQSLYHIIQGIKHIARRTYFWQNFNNLHPAFFAIRTLVYIELR